MKRPRAFGGVLPSEKETVRVLCAPNAFKECLTASQVASAMSKGIIKAASAVPVIIDQVPLGDGGDGTMDALCDAFPGFCRRISLKVEDPLGRTVEGCYCILQRDGENRKKAVVEIANASGLWRLSRSEQNPMRTSSFGSGQLLRDAIINEKVDDIMICLGGSATNDGGVGLAAALGFKFFAQDHWIERPCGRDLERISRIESPDDEIMGWLKGGHVEAACDVDHVLVGEHGAVLGFAAQKGASASDMVHLENGLSNLARLWKEQGIDVIDKRGSGAAGGLGAGVIAFLSGSLRPGFGLVSDALNFASYVEQADIVFSGEGKIDASTRSGKVPHGVSMHCKHYRKPCFLIGGSIPESSEEMDELRGHGATSVFSISPGPISLEHSQERAQQLIALTCENIMRTYLCHHE